MFEQILPSLAEKRQVIAVELQGHGHTADVDRPLSIELMSDDIAALINHLGLKNVDMMGYSLGGGVALQTAIRHPTAIRKLTLVSTPCKSQGWYPEVLVGMASMNAESAQAMIGSPPHQAYASAAPKPQDWPALVEKTGRLLKQDYDWSADVAALKVPTLLVFADADSVRPEHIVEMFQLRGGGKQDAGWDGSGMSNARLAILPGTTHYNIFSSPMLVSAITPFLDASLSVVK
jgi:pimeloyl-ACP methyl ester carboxylesterase